MGPLQAISLGTRFNSNATSFADRTGCIKFGQGCGAVSMRASSVQTGEMIILCRCIPLAANLGVLING